MSITSLFAAERDRYVSYFDATVAEAKAKNPRCASELLISINNEALPYPYRYIRVDLAEKLGDGSDRLSEIWLDPATDAEGKGFRFGDNTVEVHPFTWCAAQIVFDQPLPDVGRLEQLLTRWLDVDDRADVETRPIHSATPIESNGQFWYLTIDLGTAPAQALVEVIELLLEEGMTRLIVVSQPR